MEQIQLLKLLNKAEKQVKWGITSQRQNNPFKEKIYWINSNKRKKKNPYGKKKKVVILLNDRIKMYRSFYELMELMGKEDSPF